MIIFEDHALLYSLLFFLVIVTLLVLFWTMRDNRKKNIATEDTDTTKLSETIPELKKDSEYKDPQSPPRIIRSKNTLPCDQDLTLQNGITLLKQHKLEEAELCLQAVLDKATSEKDLTAQCEARYYLAKLNKEMGDLTLACEHWQIARDLYKQSGNKGRIEEIEKYMRENGCPTDWVLNGF